MPVSGVTGHMAKRTAEQEAAAINLADAFLQGRTLITISVASGRWLYELDGPVWRRRPEHQLEMLMLAKLGEGTSKRTLNIAATAAGEVLDRTWAHWPRFSSLKSAEQTLGGNIDQVAIERMTELSKGPSN